MKQFLSIYNGLIQKKDNVDENSNYVELLPVLGYYNYSKNLLPIFIITFYKLIISKNIFVV